MKFTSKPVFVAGLALLGSGLLVASPVQAQVNGFAVNDPAVAFALSRTRNTAFEQIGQSFQGQIQLIGSLDAEISTLSAGLDTNKDQQITQEEYNANPALVAQIEAKQSQIDMATQPIAMAHMYVLEQLMADFSNAQNEVMTEKGVTIVLTPEAVLGAPNEIYITAAVAAKIDQRQPTVAITPPPGWQPQRSTVNTYEEVQQVVMLLSAQARAQQQQPGGAPASAPPAQAGPPAEGR